MAKDTDEEPSQQTSNSASRAGIIKKTIRKINALEAERKLVGAQITEIKQRVIKGDLGMKISDFNAALRLYGLEDEDRATYLDTLRETFEALGIGGQLSMFGETEGASTTEGTHAHRSLPEDDTFPADTTP